MLDGATSRMLHARSYTGRMLDPVADKAFALGVIVTFLTEGTFTVLEVTLLGLRDIAVLVGVTWLACLGDWAALRRLPPSWLGKITTFLQCAYILILLTWKTWHWSMLAVTAFFSGLAAIHYSWLFLQRRRRLLSHPST
jgi:phosphatidylglycerophosphate synthase